MFDHVTLRVPDLAAARTSFAVVLDALEIEETTSTPSFAVWGNFALTQADDDHPVARGVHVAFISPTPDHVDRFAQAGIDVGFADDGPAGPRPDYGDDYYAAFLKDGDGNSFEAVHRDGERPLGNIDHLAIRVNDLDASAMFYWTIADSVGLGLRRQTVGLIEFSVDGAEGSLIVTAGEPTENVHVAFSGDDEEVRRFHADATAAGYRSNGEPGERPRYHDGYYAAYVLDPDGNNIEVVNHHQIAVQHGTPALDAGSLRKEHLMSMDQNEMRPRPNIVLVHGAWADGSSWSSVIERLQSDGYHVTAPQFPLTSLADDVARLRRVLARQEGPTVIVGHSYGGQVMTALGNDAPNVVGLVYIAAFGLDEGESLGGLLAQGPPTPALAHQFVDEDGFVWLTEDDFVNHFAGDVDPVKANVLYAVQQPLAASAFDDVMGMPAWKAFRSWYLITQDDQALPPDAERMFADRMGAKAVEVPSGHLAMVSHPAEVVKLTETAAEAALAVNSVA